MIVSERDKELIGKYLWATMNKTWKTNYNLRTIHEILRCFSLLKDVDLETIRACINEELQRRDYNRKHHFEVIWR